MHDFTLYLINNPALVRLEGHLPVMVEKGKESRLDVDGFDAGSMVDEVEGAKENEVPALTPEIFANLPGAVQPLFRHWVR